MSIFIYIQLEANELPQLIQNEASITGEMLEAIDEGEAEILKFDPAVGEGRIQRCVVDSKVHEAEEEGDEDQVEYSIGAWETIS